MPVPLTHQRIVCYIPDAPERGRYGRLSNFLPLLRLFFDVLRGIERPRVSITARFGNLVFTSLRYEVVSLLIFVF